MPTMQDMCYGFEGSVLYSFFSEDGATEISRISLCSHSLKAVDKDSIFIGTADTADYVLSLWNNIHTLNLCVAECQDPAAYDSLEMPHLNIVVTSQSVADAHNIISTNIANFENWRERLMNISVRDDSVGTLLATAVSIFDQQISLYLLSPTFHLIDFRSVNNSPESAIAKMQNGVSASDAQIDFLIKSSQDETTTAYSTEPIMENNALRGFLLIVRSKDVIVPQCFINLITQLIPIHIYKTFPVVDSHIQKCSDLLTDILLFNPNDVDPLYKRLKELPYPLKPSMRMMLVAYDPGRFLAKSIINDLGKIFPHHNIGIYDRHIIVLLSGDTFLFRPSYNEGKLESLLEKYDSYAVFTAAVRFIRGMRIFYQQARDILPVMRNADITEGHRAAYYDDIFEYGRAQLCISAFRNQKERAKLTYLLHPFVAELLRYDDGNGTDYSTFAFAFAENNGNIAKTADRTNYHRNTIYNKLDRIRKIFDVDLNDSTIQRELVFSSHGMKVAKAEGVASDRFIIYQEQRYPDSH